MTHNSLYNALSDEAHIWLVDPQRHADSELSAGYLRMLSKDERAKEQRFAFARERDLYLLSHGLLRTTLSRYLPIDPRSWTFTRNQYGRPEIAGPQQDQRLRFNISRTRGLAVCLIVRSIDAGIDVEEVRDPNPRTMRSRQVFTPEEIATMEALPDDGRRERFFALWTLKEAYVKALGVGLSLPPSRLAFRFSGNGHIGLSMDRRMKDGRSEWQFASVRPTSSHAVSVALRKGAGNGNLRIRLFEAMPRPARRGAPRHGFAEHMGAWAGDFGYGGVDSGVSTTARTEAALPVEWPGPHQLGREYTRENRGPWTWASNRDEPMNDEPMEDRRNHQRGGHR